jgi:DNA-binding MarR family transcriptional regulator
MTMPAARAHLASAALPREELLVEALVHASRVFRHSLHPALEREGLTSPMFWALHQLVVEGPLSVGGIAGACDVTSANISSAAEQLEAAGLVVRHSAAPDRRFVMLKATPRGRALHAEVSRRLARVLVQSLEGLPSSDLEAAVRVLERLAGSASHHPTSPEGGAP